VAQKPRVQQEVTEQMQTSFWIVIPETNASDIEKSWIKYVRNNKRGKSLKLNGVLEQMDISYPNISNLPFEVHSKLTETLDGVYQTVWLTQNSISFISNNPQSLDNMAVQKYIQDFAVEEYINALKNNLEMCQKIESILNKELDELIKVRDQSKSKINENKNYSISNTAVIAENQKDIDSKNVKIYDQRI